MIDWGRVIWILRQDAGLTQTQLADKLGISSRTIQHWEQTGKPIETVERLLAALGWQLDMKKVASPGDDSEESVTIRTLRAALNFFP